MSSHSLVAIAGRVPEYLPRASRPLKEHEIFPEREGQQIYLEELLTDVCILHIAEGCACFYLMEEEVRRLIIRYDWHDDTLVRSK